MYQQWKQYRQIREATDFNARVDLLCENVVLSGLTFDEWFKSSVLPRVLSESYDTTDEIVNDLINELWNMGGLLPWGKDNIWRGNKPQPSPAPPGAEDFMNQLGAGSASIAAPRSGPDPANSPFANLGGGPAAGGPAAGGPAAGGKTNAQGQLGADAQAKLRASAATIKTKLGNALQGVITQTKQNRDSLGFQLANLLSQRLSGMVDEFVGKLRKGSGKFDKTKEFGAGANAGAQGVSDRWSQQLSNPATAQKIAAQYAQKLGVTPDKIMNLIQAGFTNPSQWANFVKANQAGGGLTPGLGAAPQPTEPMAQTGNDPEAIRLKQALAKKQKVAAMRSMMRRFMNKR